MVDRSKSGFSRLNCTICINGSRGSSFTTKSGFNNVEILVTVKDFPAKKSSFFVFELLILILFVFIRNSDMFNLSFGRTKAAAGSPGKSARARLFPY